jgi:hypothetical protein
MQRFYISFNNFEVIWAPTAESLRSGSVPCTCAYVCEQGCAAALQLLLGLALAQFEDIDIKGVAALVANLNSSTDRQVPQHPRLH